MYIFEAHYTNMDNDEEITRKIEFDGQFLENNKEFLANLRSVGCIRNLFRNLLKAEERQKRHTGRNGETSRK